MRRETKEEKLLYRVPMLVNEIFISGDGYVYPVCPRCGCSFEHEYQAFCDRCGQKLSWKGFQRSKNKICYGN